MGPSSQQPVLVFVRSTRDPGSDTRSPTHELGLKCVSPSIAHVKGMDFPLCGRFYRGCMEPASEVAKLFPTTTPCSHKQATRDPARDPFHCSVTTILVGVVQSILHMVQKWKNFVPEIATRDEICTRSTELPRTELFGATILSRNLAVSVHSRSGTHVRRFLISTRTLSLRTRVP